VATTAIPQLMASTGTARRARPTHSGRRARRSSGRGGAPRRARHGREA
jgi:hypothetical protein